MNIEKAKQIMFLLSLGHTASQIGGKVALRTRTVEKYLETLKAAHGAKNAPHLVGIAIRRKLIQ